MKYEIEGLDKVIDLLDDIEKLPQKCVTQAAKSGAEIALNEAKAKAPVDTGLLRKSIKMKAEGSKQKGKKVYQIRFEGEGLAKVSKEGNRSFYPVSQEYGWTDKNGKKHTPKTTGFFRGAIDNNRNRITEKTVSVLAEELDKLR
jgi:HK97 gp10 family phage protein